VRLELPDELIKVQPATSEEEEEGLRILARLIAEAVIKDSLAQQHPADNKSG
jgi:hypothetical protein